MQLLNGLIYKEKVAKIKYLPKRAHRTLSLSWSGALISSRSDALSVSRSVVSLGK